MARTMVSMGNGVPVMTPRHHHNESVKTRFVEGLFRNDWELLATLVHSEFELREPDALAYGGIYKGIEGFKKCWELIAAAGLKTEHLDTLRCFFTEDPDSIVVELETRGLVVSTGEAFSSKVMEQFDFKDGLISAIVLHWFNIPRF